MWQVCEPVSRVLLGRHFWTFAWATAINILEMHHLNCLFRPSALDEMPDGVPSGICLCLMRLFSKAFYVISCSLQSHGVVPQHGIQATCIYIYICIHTF